MDYKIIFEDKVQGTVEETFENFPDAMDFWNEYADTDTCVYGQMVYTPTNEVIWEF